MATICISSAQTFTFVQPKEFLLFRPDVQKEISFTSAQLDKIKAVVGDAISFTPEGRMQMRITSDSQSPEEMAKEISKVPDAKQTLRLEELWIQKTGAFVLVNEPIGKRLELTSTQKSKAAAILEEYGEQLRQKLESNDGRLDMREMEGVKAGFAKRLEAILDANQKQKFESMKGKPFKFDEPKKSSQ